MGLVIKNGGIELGLLENIGDENLSQEDIQRKEYLKSLPKDQWIHLDKEGMMISDQKSKNEIDLSRYRVINNPKMTIISGIQIALFHQELKRVIDRIEEKIEERANKLAQGFKDVRALDHTISELTGKLDGIRSMLDIMGIRRELEIHLELKGQKPKSDQCKSVLQMMDEGIEYPEALNLTLNLFDDVSRTDLENELKAYI